MDQLYLSVELGENRTLCLAPLSDRKLAMSGQEIDDPSGYFLYEKVGDGDFATIEILARIVSDVAVSRLQAQFNLA
ncbi:hypothetical protein [Aquidulcibacter sp.]|uniref:hypothetical protein n=1 Tax=Aquidulcibacter sp. TaxID=2052990 RepID=UPI003BA64905